MTAVIGDITMSVDGFVAGPEHALGADDEALHRWALASRDPVDRAQLTSVTADAGAVVMGRRTFDTVDSADGWRDGMGYGADLDGRSPFFVVTSARPAHVRLAGTHDVTFVLGGAATAVAAARAVAGPRDVYVMGGGTLVGSCLAAGLLDRLRLHLAPEVLGAGIPLLADVGRRRLVQREVAVSPTAVHLTYDVER